MDLDALHLDIKEEVFEVKEVRGHVLDAIDRLAEVEGDSSVDGLGDVVTKGGSVRYEVGLEEGVCVLDV